MRFSIFLRVSPQLYLLSSTHENDHDLDNGIVLVTHLASYSSMNFCVSCYYYLCSVLQVIGSIATYELLLVQQDEGFHGFESEEAQNASDVTTGWT